MNIQVEVTGLTYMNRRTLVRKVLHELDSNILEQIMNIRNCDYKRTILHLCTKSHEYLRTGVQVMYESLFNPITALPLIIYSLYWALSRKFVLQTSL